MSSATSSCPHCGKTVLDSDKFCIFCGKPLKKIKFTENKGPSIGFGDSDTPDADVVKKEQSQPQKGSGKKEELNKDLSKEDSVEDAENEKVKGKGKEKDSDKEKEKDKDKSKKKTKEEEEEDALALSVLTDKVKDQMKVKIRLLEISEKKKKLKVKLEELMKDMKGDRYSKDYTFMTEVNTRLKAIQNIKAELEAEEAKAQAELGGEFKVEELERIMKEKDSQLTELTKTYKMRKIDEDVFKQLKKEYEKEYKDAEKELRLLRKGLVRWVQEIKGQRARIETDLKVAKARSIAKELTKEDYEKIEEEKLTELNNLDKQIKYIEMYAYNKKISWF